MARGGVITILIPKDQEDAARARADGALAKLRQGERFEVVAKQYSDDPGERISGGTISWVVADQPSRRYPPEVVEALFALPSRGAVAGPIQTDRAFYLVTLTEKRPGELPPFEQVRPEVARRLARERRGQAYNDYCEQLKKDFPVTVNDEELAKAVEPATPNSGPPMGPINLK
jgi:parvulin-like peptidyl-prolyl isomerase